MFQTLASFARLTRAALVLARHDALLPAEYQDRLPPTARFVGKAARLFARPDEGVRPGVRLARALEQLGPAYIKLGQLLATRGDIVGTELAQDLSALKDDVPAFPTLEAERTIEIELGRSPGDLFLAFGPPVAAASVAQVHEALTPDGDRVAVKVLRPGVEAELARDVRAFRLAASLADRFFPSLRRLEPRAFVETLARSMTIETDLRLEAAAASELADIAVDVEGFRVPAVDWARSGKRVLTTEWIEGARLSDDAALEAIGADRQALADVVVRAFLISALDHGVFHADMHEGNLFADEEGDLVAVDFGIMGRIGAAERRYLAEILHGFLIRDYTRVAEVHFEAGYVPDRHTVAEFAGALRAVGEPVIGKAADQVSMGRLLLQLFEITELFDMRLRPELVLLQKTMVQVEGVARRLDPSHDLWASARPVVERWIRRELGPEGVVRDAAADLGKLRAIVRRLPRTLEDINTAAEVIASGGVRLDDDTVRRLAEANARATRGRGAAVWVLAIAAVAVAGAAVAAAWG